MHINYHNDDFDTLMMIVVPGGDVDDSCDAKSAVVDFFFFFFFFQQYTHLAMNCLQYVGSGGKSQYENHTQQNFYWTEELQHLEYDVNVTREKVEKELTTENNIYLKAKTVSCKQTFTETPRSRWN